MPIDMSQLQQLAQNRARQVGALNPNNGNPGGIHNTSPSSFPRAPAATPYGSSAGATPYGYSNDSALNGVYMGGQNAALGRYVPPSYNYGQRGEVLWNDHGGYAYNLPNAYGPNDSYAAFGNGGMPGSPNYVPQFAGALQQIAEGRGGGSNSPDLMAFLQQLMQRSGQRQTGQPEPMGMMPGRPAGIPVGAYQDAVGAAQGPVPVMSDDPQLPVGGPQVLPAIGEGAQGRMGGYGGSAAPIGWAGRVGGMGGGGGGAPSAGGGMVGGGSRVGGGVPNLPQTITRNPGPSGFDRNGNLSQTISFNRDIAGSPSGNNQGSGWRQMLQPGALIRRTQAGRSVWDFLFGT